MSNLSNIRKQIEDLYPEISPVFQKIARFVLKEPSKIAIYPIREIASMAGVSTSTVIRFVAAMGFSSYQAFRDTLREDLSSPGVSRYGIDARQLLSYRKGDGRGELWAATTEKLVQNLVEAHDTVSAAEVQRVAHLLRRAGRVGIVGFSGIYPAAFYLRYVLSYVLEDVRLFEDKIPTFLHDLPAFGRGDVVLIISFEPYAVTAVTIAQYCVANKIPHIAITDTPLSPVALDAKHTLVVPSAGTSFYQTLVPTLALIEGIAAHLVAEIGESAVERVREAFRKREELGVYWRADH